MGTWGNGNLESDAARDSIYSASEELFDLVVKLLKDPLSAEYDEDPYYDLFVRVEMIIALNKHSLINTTPSSEEIEKLIPPYMERWSKYQLDCGRLDEERKKVIEDTFNKLLEITSEYSNCNLDDFDSESEEEINHPDITDSKNLSIAEMILKTIDENEAKND